MRRILIVCLSLSLTFISTLPTVASNPALLNGSDSVVQSQNYTKYWDIRSGSLVVSNWPGVTNTGGSSFAPSSESPDYQAVIPFCSEQPEGPCIKSFKAKSDGSSWIDSQISEIQTPRLDCMGCGLGSPSGVLRKPTFLPYDPVNNVPAMDTSKYLYFSDEDRSENRFFELAVNLFKTPQISDTVGIRVGLQSVQLGEVKRYSIDGVMKTYREIKELKMPSDVTFEVTIDLKKLFPSLSRWLYSDAVESAIAIDGSTLTLTGRPSVLSIVSTDPIDCDLASEKDWSSSFSGWINSRNFSTQQWIQFCKSKPEAYPIQLQEFYRGTVAHFENWSTRLIPRYEWTSWRFDAIDLTEEKIDPSVLYCLGENDFIFSSSNALARETQLPTWNGYEKKFTTKIASNSKLSSGANNKGFYTLSISTNAARCLWGKDISLPQFSLSVVDSKGTPVVSTTERISKDDFFNLRIFGFPYSQKIISFGVPQSKSKMKSTITCAKGKVTKKVTAVNPKCPAGYKKK